MDDLELMLVCSPLKMFSIFVTLFFLRCTENRICSGTHGFDCCYGFSLNKMTGICEECSIGYHGHNCAMKCRPPTYGKGCQTICNCSVEDCHFAHGCIEKLETTTDDNQQNNTLSAVYKRSSKAVSKSSVPFDSITDVNKHSDTTLIYMFQDIDLLKNSFVIGFIGVFACSFLIFVLTYISKKCFGEIRRESGIEENKRQAQYKSLRLELVEQECKSYRKLEEQSNAESEYITPVPNSINDRSEIETGHEKEGNARNSPRPTNAENERHISLEDETHQVYIEIA